MVRPSGRGDLAKVVVSERSPKRGPLVPPQRNPETPPTASSQDLSSLHRRERSSLVKNRTRESCTSGSVRGGDGNVPTYSAKVIVVGRSLAISTAPTGQRSAAG